MLSFINGLTTSRRGLFTIHKSSYPRYHSSLEIKITYTIDIKPKRTFYSLINTLK